MKVNEYYAIANLDLQNCSFDDKMATRDDIEMVAISGDLALEWLYK